MKVLLAICAALLLAACSGRPLSNAEIVQQLKYCNDNGLRPRYDSFSGKITDIQCQPERIVNAGENK